VANAGPDRNAYTGVAIVLQGSATDLENDPIVAWQWFVDSAPAGGAYDLVPPTNNPTLFVGYGPGDYVLMFVAEDLTLLRKSGLSFYPVFRSFDSSNFAGLT
jgi:hypothetical protein